MKNRFSTFKPDRLAFTTTLVVITSLIGGVQHFRDLFEKPSDGWLDYIEVTSIGFTFRLRVMLIQYLVIFFTSHEKKILTFASHRRVYKEQGEGLYSVTFKETARQEKHTKAQALTHTEAEAKDFSKYAGRNVGHKANNWKIPYVFVPLLQRFLKRIIALDHGG
ncbi:hypothetical protein ACJX0J_024774 [Zea mays]